MSRIVVFGGFNVERDTAGRWCTTIHFSQFLDSLCERFESVTFVTWENAKPAGYRSVISNSSIEIVAVPRGVRQRLNLVRIFLHHAHDAHLWIHLPNGVCLFPGWRAIRRVAKSITIYLANDYVQFCEFSRYRKIPGGKAYFFAAHKRMIAAADNVIARGRKLAMQASQFNQHVTETIPIVGMPPQRDHAVRRSHDNGNITFFGQLLWGKGLKELITAFAALKRNQLVGDSKLVIVGAGADGDEIRSYAAELLSDDEYAFLGWLDASDDLENAWRNARLLVVPTSGYGEGVPRTIDEAMVRGVPVVATRAGGIAEEYQLGEAVLVDPGDTQGLQDAIESVVSDAALRERMARAAHQRVARWDEFTDPGHQHAEIILGPANDASAPPE